MSDDVESLMLEQFRRLHQRLDRKDLEDMEVKMRLNSLDEHMAGIMTSLVRMNSRFDRLEERVVRIERRLDLADAH